MLEHYAPTSAGVGEELAVTDTTGDSADQALWEDAREIAAALGRTKSDVAQSIRHALQQIEKGTYGICEECGKRISQVRLEALLAVDTCVYCQREIDAAKK